MLMCIILRTENIGLNFLSKVFISDIIPNVSENFIKRGDIMSEAMKDNNAILMINGDFCSLANAGPMSIVKEGEN